jgi:alkanesulfonate monooxygenase SsuD/methylene tetrahydromethanopterin reductase-like flavin-dependent oxidoreductase (luciferase family)
MEMFRPVVEAYEEAWEAAGHPASARRIGCCNHAFVHRDSATARRIWEPRYRAYVEAVNDLQRASSQGQGSGMGAFDFDERAASVALCGSPEQLIDRIGINRELLHLDTQLLMFDMGGIPDPELFAAIELAGTEVLPHLGSGDTTPRAAGS